MIEAVAEHVSLADISAHFHDTYGLGVANVLEAVRMGIRTVDAAAGGLGGCPFAPGASGNVATEDVLYMLQGEGYETGLSMEKLLDAVSFCESDLGIAPVSRVYKALRGA